MRNAVGVWGQIVVVVGTAENVDHIGIVWTVATDWTDWTDTDWIEIKQNPDSSDLQCNNMSH